MTEQDGPETYYAKENDEARNKAMEGNTAAQQLQAAASQMTAETGKEILAELKQSNQIAMLDTTNRHIYDALDVPWTAHAIFKEWITHPDGNIPSLDGLGEVDMAHKAFDVAEAFYAEMQRRMQQNAIAVPPGPDSGMQG